MRFIVIKNWKLAVLTLVLLSCFIALGLWQLQRAKLKEEAILHYQAQLMRPPLSNLDLSTPKAIQYASFELTGNFDDAHTFLLDNKIHHSRVGYEVYTLFFADHFPLPILIDRGFIAAKNRHSLPQIKPVPGKVKVKGMLNFPPKYISFANMLETKHFSWPLRIQFINLSELNQLLNTNLYPKVLILNENHNAAYEHSWQLHTMPPERHIGYAVQWFALALTLLILFVALNRKEQNHYKNK